MPDFIQQQNAFARHMRDPENTQAPDNVEERRVEIYRGLMYRNVEKFMKGAFPVLRKIVDDEQWHAMIRHFFKTHRSHTPLFPKMPQEFVLYIQNERDNEDDPPFIKELTHYEWIEMSLIFDNREIDMEGVDSKGDLSMGVPIMNPLTLTLSYEYPVHRIGPNYLPEEPPEQMTHLVVYRNEKDKVGFMELNAVSARLLNLIAEDKKRIGQALLEQIASELQHPNPDVVVQGGRQILQQLHSKSVLLGVVA